MDNRIMAGSPVKALASIKSDALRDLAKSKLAGPHASDQGDHQLNPEFREWVLKQAIRPAAVLVPFVERRERINVILTKRMDHLKSHSGQVAFPGGKIDEADPDAVAAALREAHEEIDLQPNDVEVIGQLPDYHTGSGYRISPVLGIVKPNAVMSANPEEVDYVFEVPLSYLMDPANHNRGSREFGGSRRYYFEMPYQDHYIWGVTANMLRMLYEQMFK